MQKTLIVYRTKNNKSPLRIGFTLYATKYRQPELKLGWQELPGEIMVIISVLAG